MPPPIGVKGFFFQCRVQCAHCVRLTVVNNSMNEKIDTGRKKKKRRLSRVNLCVDKYLFHTEHTAVSSKRLNLIF